MISVDMISICLKLNIDMKIPSQQNAITDFLYTILSWNKQKNAIQKDCILKFGWGGRI